MLGLAKLKGQGIFLINVSRREKGKTKLNKETEKQKGAELFKLKKNAETRTNGVWRGQEKFWTRNKKMLQLTSWGSISVCSKPECL